jgi:hypothetical protein
MPADFIPVSRGENEPIRHSALWLDGGATCLVCGKPVEGHGYELTPLAKCSSCGAMKVDVISWGPGSNRGPKRCAACQMLANAVARIIARSGWINQHHAVEGPRE